MYRGGAEVIPDREGSEPRRDEAELSNRLRTDDANCRTGMENSRQAKLAVLGVISPSLLASAPDP